MQPFTITLALLVELDACSDQRDAFASAFPDGLALNSEEPDEATVDRIVAAELDVTWFAQRVLPHAAWAEYERVRDAALAEYVRATAPAWAEYERVRDAALAEYERVEDAALAEYERVRAPAQAEYERATSAAETEYRRVQVRCLWSLLVKPESRRLP